MPKDYAAIARDLKSGYGELAKAGPVAMKAFAGFMQAASADGALDHKTKELIAIAISIAVRCESCIAYHVEAAHKAGATRAEVAETIVVAVELGGGPAASYGIEALRAYDQFAG